MNQAYSKTKYNLAGKCVKFSTHNSSEEVMKRVIFKI
jgi:hypothetical protein